MSIVGGAGVAVGSVAPPSVAGGSLIGTGVEQQDSGNQSYLESIADDNGYIDTPALLTAIGDWRSGNIQTPVLLEAIQYWRSGESVVDDTDSGLTTLTSVGSDADLWDPNHSEFSGNSDAVEQLGVDGDFTVFSFSHQAQGNFAIEILDGNGDFVDLVANEIGNVEGTRGTALANGDYQLDITADGPWELRVAQPLPSAEEIHQVPAEAAGDADDVVGLIDLSGGETVKGTHDGDSNYIVQAWEENATSAIFDAELWINEIGQYDGEIVNGTSGVAWIEVQADGEWTLEIE